MWFRITSTRRFSWLTTSLMQYADDTALDKKTFTAMMKKYVKQVRMLLKETNPSREEGFVNEMNEYIKTILKNFKDYDYYHGTCDYDAMVGSSFVSL